MATDVVHSFLVNGFCHTCYDPMFLSILHIIGQFPALIGFSGEPATARTRDQRSEREAEMKDSFKIRNRELEEERKIAENRY